jgi:nucleoside-diphosphate-sugar epimerase
MPETVLVTGGTGFVGGWCIAELLKRGYAVRATVRSLAKEKALQTYIGAAAGSTERLSVAIADLTRDDGWDAAMWGCDFVLHVASPLGAGGESAQSLIDAAREGTLRVLRAATKAGVKRVVLTSSCAAATPTETTADSISDEAVWSDPASLAAEPYRLSKTLAERAAWDFMATSGEGTELVTILPSAVLGPVLSKDGLGSVQLIQRMMDGRMPLIPRAGLCIVDVRDLADLHVRAMITPEAAGQRFIASGDFMWMQDVAATVKGRLGARGANVPTRPLPDFVVRLLAPVMLQMRVLKPLLGRRHRFSFAKAQRLLGYAPRRATETVVDCVESLFSETRATA